MIDSCRVPTGISRRRFMHGAVCAAAGTTLAGLSSAFARGRTALGLGEQVADLPRSLSPVSGSGQAYRTVIAGRDLVFVPYFTVDTEKYNTYFRIA